MSRFNVTLRNVQNTSSCVRVVERDVELCRSPALASSLLASPLAREPSLLHPCLGPAPRRARRRRTSLRSPSLSRARSLRRHRWRRARIRAPSSGFAKASARARTAPPCSRARIHASCSTSARRAALRRARANSTRARAWRCARESSSAIPRWSRFATAASRSSARADAMSR